MSDEETTEPAGGEPTPGGARRPAPGPGPGGKPAARPEFKLHRTSAKEREAPASFPWLLVVLVLAGAGGGYWYYSQQKAGGDAAGAGADDDGASQGTPRFKIEAPPDVDVPAHVYEEIESRANSPSLGGAAKAVEIGDQYLAQYPNAKLRERLTKLRADNDLPLGPGDLLNEARRHLNDGKYAEAAAAAERAVEQEPASALYLRGVARGLSKQTKEALEDLNDALTRGHPQPERVRAWIKHFGGEAPPP